MNHLGTQELKTERLVLRRFTIDDAPYMFKNWASDPVVTKYLTWPSHDSVEVSKQVLNTWIADYSKDSFYLWAIVLQSLNEPIGSIGVANQNESIGMVEIGYCIGSQWWNQGFTSEALNRIIEYFFQEVKANRIASRHDPCNMNSGKVMLKCGMQYEGTSRQSDRSNQGICDASFYGILARRLFESEKSIMEES